MRPAPARWLPLLLTGVALIAVGAVAVSGLDEALVYYRTPTEVARHRTGPQDRLRVGGLVLPRSVRADGDAVRFRLGDGVTALEVVHRGERSPVFREGQGAIVEGTLSPAGVLLADRLMVKHSEEYRAEDSGR